MCQVQKPYHEKEEETRVKQDDSKNKPDEFLVHKRIKDLVFCERPFDVDRHTQGQEAECQAKNIHLIVHCLEPIVLFLVVLAVFVGG